jgi:hypothetical protein
MAQIPTAKKYLQDSDTYDKDYSTISLYDAEQRMLEFAKLHVRAAIAECIDCAPTSSTDPIYRSDVEECLTDCYPLENIK